MVNVFKKFLVRLASLAINLQLLISPMALSQQTEVKQTRSKFWDTAGSVAQNLAGAVGMGMQLVSKNQNQTTMSSHLIKPINPMQLPPALQAAGCIVYEAKGSVPPSDQICSPKKADPSPASAMMTQQLYTTAKRNVNDLDNYLINGNESVTSQGAACLNKAMFNLQRELKERVEQLNQFEKLVEDTFKASKKIMEKDLKALYKGDALINGKKGDKENSLADFDFGKQFKSQACASFITEGDLAKSGEEGGYRAIEDLLNKNFETSSSEGSYSPKELFGNQDKIEKDIDGILSNMENNITNEATATFDEKMLMDGAQTSSFSLENAALKNVVSNELKTYKRLLEAKKKQLLKTVDKESLEKIEDGTNSSSDIAQTFRRNQYNKCLAGYVGDSKSFAKSITNFTLTESANSDRDSLLRSKVYDNLMDAEIDIEQKIANISQFDTSKSERIRMSSSQKLCGKTIYADTRISVSSLMSLYKCECEKQYNSKRGGSLSAQEAEDQLANYSNFVSTEKGKLFNGLATQIKNKVLNCPEDSSTGQGALTCGDSLSKDSKNFCLRTANICAGNMKACFDEANKMLVDTRAEQKVIAKRYNANMDQLKRNLQQAFKINEQQIEASSRTLDAQYQVGSVYKSPLNLQMDQLKDKFIEGFDQSLQVEDPDKYLEIIKADIATAKQELIKSNTDIFGSDPEQFNGLASGTSSTKGFLGKVSEYIKNANAEKLRWEKILSDCDQTIDRMNQMITEQNKKNGEEFAKQQQKQDYMKKRCEILKYGCKDAAWMVGAQDIFGVTNAASGTGAKNPMDQYCSDDSSDSTEDDAKNLRASKDIQDQRDAIITFCDDIDKHSEEVKNKVGNSCSKYLSKDDNSQPSKTICEKDIESYASEENYNLVLDEPSKNISSRIKEIKSDISKIENTNPISTSNQERLDKLKEELSEKKGITPVYVITNKQNTDLKNISFKEAKGINGVTEEKLIEFYEDNLMKCTMPSDSSIKRLADAAYLYKYQKYTAHKEYGEHPEGKTDCENILASSTGSGDKDEYGTSGAAAGLDSFFKAFTQQQ